MDIGAENSFGILGAGLFVSIVLHFSTNLSILPLYSDICDLVCDEVRTIFAMELRSNLFNASFAQFLFIPFVLSASFEDNFVRFFACFLSL